MNQRIIEELNKLLMMEFMAIKSYMLNGLNFKHKAYCKLAKMFLCQGTKGEGRHAMCLTKRIFMLGGRINLQCNANHSNMNFEVSDSVEGALNNALKFENDLISQLQDTIAFSAEEAKDYGTVQTLMCILHDAECQKLCLEQQINLIKSMGIQNYIESIAKECHDHDQHHMNKHDMYKKHHKDGDHH